MRANREIYQDPLPLKMKNKWICQKIGVKSPRQLILEAGAKMINGVVKTGRPYQLYNQIIFPRKFRKTARLNTVKVPRTQKAKRSTFYQIVGIFNSLSDDLKFLHPKIFKKVIAKRTILEIPVD